MRFRSLVSLTLCAAALVLALGSNSSAEVCNSTVYIQADRCPGSGPRSGANVEIFAMTGGNNPQISGLLASGSTNMAGALTLNFAWPTGGYTQCLVKYRIGPGSPWLAYTTGVTPAGALCPDGINLTDGGFAPQACDEWVDETTSPYTLYLKF